MKNKTNCPKCDKEIELEDVRHYQSGVMSSDMKLDEGNLTYEEDEFDADCEYTSYVCPECLKEIAYCEEDFVKLFK